MNATIELAARLVGNNFVKLQHGEDADTWQYTMSAHDVASAFSRYRDAEIERLQGERAVLVRLLIEAEGVLVTIDPESDEEGAMLAALRRAIKDALGTKAPDLF